MSYLYAQHNWCGVKQYEGKEDQYQSFLFNIRSAESNSHLHARSTKYFQIVVHVVARDGYQPVSQAQVLQQLDVLNADFAAKGENISRLQEQFKPLVKDAEFHFCLATLDPDGNPTTGITFTSTDIEDIGVRYDEFGRRKIHYDKLGGKTSWDPTRYINIWVGENAGILGTSTMPGETVPDEEIGLVIDIHHFGAIGDAGYNNEFGRGHTLTHEMGHFFGLKHIWGDGFDESCNDSDDIDDTPNAAGPNYHCPEGLVLTSCGELNMYQNFMDLTNDQCLAAFTSDQVMRMQMVADLFYPDLDSGNSCEESITNFDSWYDQLTWSMDNGNRKIVIYNPGLSLSIKTIRVFSMDGRLVFEDEWYDDLTALINLQNVAAGVYAVNVETGEECRSRKIVVY